MMRIDFCQPDVVYVDGTNALVLDTDWCQYVIAGIASQSIVSDHQGLNIMEEYL